MAELRRFLLFLEVILVVEGATPPSSIEGTQRVELVDNGYEGVVVAISEDLTKDDAVLDKIKVMVHM